MTNLILAIVFLLLALVGIVARKTYYYLPAKELKRKASKHESPNATQLYRAVAYGSSLRSLLWVYIGLTGGVGLVILARELPIWVSVLAVGPLLWVAFSLIPATRSTAVGTRITVAITPAIVWVLNYLYPLINRGADAVENKVKAPPHTKLFERSDLTELMEQQQQQSDSRMNDEQLEIAKRALKFEDYNVGDIMVPRKLVKTVLVDDSIGPVLIDELHKAKQDYVLVRESKKGPFVGTLAFKSLNLQSQGKVGDIMEQTVYYLHENDPLNQALHAFFVTNRPVFAVVNNFEEHVGIVSIENVLEQLLGHIPGEDFDQYSNPELVSARHSKKAEPHIPPDKTDDKMVE